MEHIEGEQRMVPAPEVKVGEVIPIAVEQYTGGQWKRLGYSAGFGASGNIVSLEEWTAAVQPESRPPQGATMPTGRKGG